MLQLGDRYSGTNLYMKMKKASGKSRLAAMPIREGSAAGCGSGDLLLLSSSSATLAEKRSAPIPSFMAW